MIACILVVPNTKPPKPITTTGDAKYSKNWFSRIDFAGTLLLGAAALFLMFPLEIGGVKVPWTHPIVFGLFAVGILALVLFIINESRWAEEPAIPLRLLKHRDIVASYLTMCCISGAQTTVRDPNLVTSPSQLIVLSPSSTDWLLNTAYVFRAYVFPGHCRSVQYCGRSSPHSSCHGECSRRLGGWPSDTKVSTYRPN